MITYEDAGLPCGKDGLGELERSLGFRLTKSYEEFLTKIGGGRPIPDTFDLMDGNSITIDYLYYCSPKIDKYLNLINIRNVFRNAMPNEFLIIGCDPGGNQILISAEGGIFVWYHESGDWKSGEDAIKSGGIVKAFNDFDDMLSALYELEL